MSEEPNPIVPDVGEKSTVEPELQPATTAQGLKSYFDEKLYPRLSAALAACAEEMPEDPVKFVGNYLLKESD